MLTGTTGTFIHMIMWSKSRNICAFSDDGALWSSVAVVGRILRLSSLESLSSLSRLSGKACTNHENLESLSFSG